LTTVTGAVAGTILVSVLYEVLRRLENGFSIASIHVGGHVGLTQLTVGCLTLFVLIARRDGLFGRWELDELIPRLIFRGRQARSPQPPLSTPSEQGLGL